MTKFKIKLSFTGNHDDCMRRLDPAMVGLLPDLGVRHTDRVFPGTEVKRTISLPIGTTIGVRQFISDIIDRAAQDDFLSLRGREFEFSTKDQLDFPPELSGMKFIAANATRDSDFTFSAFVDVPYEATAAIPVHSLEVYHRYVLAPGFRVLAAASGISFQEVKESQSAFRTALTRLFPDLIVSAGLEGAHKFLGSSEIVEGPRDFSLADVVRVQQVLGLPDHTVVHFQNPDLESAEFLAKAVRVKYAL